MDKECDKEVDNYFGEVGSQSKKVDREDKVGWKMDRKESEGRKLERREGEGWKMVISSEDVEMEEEENWNDGEENDWDRDDEKKKNQNESVENDEDEEKNTKEQCLSSFEDVMELVGTGGKWNIFIFFLCTIGKCVCLCFDLEIYSSD